MTASPIDFFKSFAGELDLELMQKKFLHALLTIQNVTRGSIWIKKNGQYQCIEAAGAERENIIGIRISPDRPSIVGWVIENGEMTIADAGSDARHYRELEENLAVKSSLILCFPLLLQGGKVYGALQIIDTTPEKSHINLDKGYLEHLRNLVDIASVSLGNALLYSSRVQEKEALEKTLETIREEEIIVGHTPAFRQTMALISSYAASDFHVLITGESGTGKELVARELHEKGARSSRPFLAQNCSAIPESLLESELFGYKKGAFSGAVRDKAGLFEAADGGTVFLDEIGDMPLSIQASILRVLQNNEIKPLGETRVRHVDVRIISATNRDIKEMVAENTFRQDLFYRLSVLPVHLPSLKERKGDIPLLARHFLRKECLKRGVKEKKIRPDAMEQLTAWSWPGNIRELENLMKYLIVVVDDDIIDSSDITAGLIRLAPADQGALLPGLESASGAGEGASPGAGSSGFEGLTWMELEKKYVGYLLEKNNWNVTWAAKDSGLNRSTFASRMRRLNISRRACRR